MATRKRTTPTSRSKTTSKQATTPRRKAPVRKRPATPVSEPATESAFAVAQNEAAERVKDNKGHATAARGQSRRPLRG